MQTTTIKIRLILLLLVLAGGVDTVVGQTVYYVDTTASGNNDGSNWTDAFNFLQDALSVSQFGDEIWVAEGIYTPDTNSANPNGTGDRLAVFKLVNAVAIYGGFPIGGGTWEQRDPNNITILSGDLSGNDIPGTNPQDLLNDPCRAENSYRVVYAYMCLPQTILDGFIITGGNANGSSTSASGMFNDKNSSPTINNCIFSENSASSKGGGMYSKYFLSKPTLTGCTFIHNYAGSGGGLFNTSNSLPTLVDCNFIENYAGTSGGGIHNDYGSSILNNCTFAGNSAGTDGAGIYCINNSNPSLTDCVFNTNSAAQYGGGIYIDNGISTIADCEFTENSAGQDGGAVWLVSGESSINACTFTENSADVSEGGGIYNSQCTLGISNCTFTQNTAGTDGGGIRNYYCSPTIERCIFAENYAVTNGGGIYNYKSSPDVKECIFRSNDAANGGGIYNYYSSSPKITNCLFNCNSAEGISGCGGAINNTQLSGYGCDPILTNCTLTGNFAHISGGGIYNSSVYDNPTVSNCILWLNSDTGGTRQDESAQIHGGMNTVNYTCIQGLTGDLGGDGNIGLDPRFKDPAGPDYWPCTEDDELQLAGASPCIDAGDNNSVPEGTITDLDGCLRFYDDPNVPDTGNGDPPIVDMGAYEHDSPIPPKVCGDAQHPYPTFDLNHDCYVNFKDFALFTGEWLHCTAPECD